jgi:hypothetical protein
MRVVLHTWAWDARKSVKAFRSPVTVLFLARVERRQQLSSPVSLWLHSACKDSERAKFLQREHQLTHGTSETKSKR